MVFIFIIFKSKSYKIVSLHCAGLKSVLDKIWLTHKIITLDWSTGYEFLERVFLLLLLFCPSACVCKYMGRLKEDRGNIQNLDRYNEK